MAKKYFCDFHKFHYDHENFCHKMFLTVAYSTGLDTSKITKTSESQKSDKLKTMEIWNHMDINIEYFIVINASYYDRNS